MSTSDPSADSLLAALSKAKIPSENHAFITQFTSVIGITGYTAVDGSNPYVRAVRRDGLPDLYINWGFTNGFVSEDEIVRAAGRGVERKQSSRKGTWYVAHPLTRVHAGSPRSQDVRREASRCRCGMELSLTGVCASCD